MSRAAYNAAHYQANRAHRDASALEWRKRNRKKHLASVRAWKKRNPEKVAGYERKRRYGLSPFEFDALMLKQESACALCRCPFDAKHRAHVDHCHATGVVRGLLCPLCNSMLGRFRDQPKAFERVAAYLRGEG